MNDVMITTDILAARRQVQAHETVMRLHHRRECRKVRRAARVWLYTMQGERGLEGCQTLAHARSSVPEILIR
jgi:hypothetical protein